MDKETSKKILADHEKWIGGNGGKRADFQEAIFDYLTIGIHSAPEGALIGWGKENGTIVKLLIPAEVERSCGTTREFRAESAICTLVKNEEKKAVVENIWGITVYEEGKTVHCHKWNDDRWNECSGGIHFFLTEAEALAW